MTARITDLSSIDMLSGLNEAGEPFVTISAVDTDGNRMVGQPSPDEVRQLALRYMEAAEAAEMDSMVARFMMEKFDLKLDDATAVIHGLRAFREREQK